MTAITKHEEQNMLPADPMVSMIERVAMDPNSDLAKLERMLELKERHDAQNAKAAFNSAFAKASAEFPQIPLNGKGHNGKPYATLKDIVAHTRPVLSRYGLSLNWSTRIEGSMIVVTAKLSHEQGHFEENSLPLPADNSGSKNPVQSIGSSQTYGQRYTGQAILGLSLGEDTEDDARAAPQPDKYPSWAQTVVQDLPPTASERDKASAITDALIAQFRRKNTRLQLDNEWDRRAEIIDKLEGKYPDFHGMVVDAYNARMEEFDLQ